MSKKLISVILSALLVACGGGGGGSSAPPPVQDDIPNATIEQNTTCVESRHSVVNNARIGDPFVYANGEWKIIVPDGAPAVWDLTHTWVVRGTLEDDQFMPLSPNWFGPSNGPGSPRQYWTLSSGPTGIRLATDKRVDNTPAGELNAYVGSFINDAFTKPVCVRNHPLVTVDYTILAFAGNKARATIGFAMSLPNGDVYFLEQNLVRTEQFRLCADQRFDRCEGTFLAYFPPNANPGVIDVHALMLQVPGMTPEKVDTVQINGVYIGSEIYGLGTVDILISGYKLETR